MRCASRFTLLIGLGIVCLLVTGPAFALEKLVVGGTKQTTRSMSGGFTFPDGTTMTSATINIFPIVNTANSVQPLLDLTNTGSGSAGIFSAVNSSAVSGSTSGSGSGVTGSTSGSGPGVYGFSSGTGNAGSFSIGNAANGSPAIAGSTTGTGNAGNFTINNSTNSVAALYASTNGTGAAIYGYQTGTARAGNFTINNLTSSASALYATTNGTGAAIYGYQTGTARAGNFTIDNLTSSANALYATTNGLGVAGSFENTNAANSKATLYSTTNGTGAAIYGYQTGTARAGNFAIDNLTSSANALYATTNGTGAAIYGYQTGTARAGNFTIENLSNSADALYATTNGTGNGLYATTTGSGYAAWFAGNVNIVGTLSKTAGSFRIDHPLDPRNKYLSHSFVESPDMKNIYDGVVVTDEAGYATVEFPVWFEALNKDFRYQLTVIDESDNDGFVQAKVVRGVVDGGFTLRTSAPHAKVSWQVTGIRKDAYAEQHRIVVEEDKPAGEKGTCLYPGACAAN